MVKCDIRELFDDQSFIGLGLKDLGCSFACFPRML